MTNVEPSYSTAALFARWSVLAFALFLAGSNSFVIAGVLPEIAGDLGVTPTGIGYTITIYAVLVAVLSPIIAVVLPRWSRTVLIVGGLGVFVVGVVIAAVSPDYLVFTIGRIVAAVGGAALVPTATAAGAAITPPAKRGRAIAVVGIGFTLASAIGAPLGTALASASSWRVPMVIIAVLGALVMPVLALLVRRVPLGEPISVARRFAVLRDARILMPLLTTLFVAAGFNLVFIFSSAVTGFQGTALAALLLVYGVMGIIGNTVAGPLTDRLGSRRVGAMFMILETIALAGIALVGHSFVGLAAAFVVWGVSAFASVVPVQHRLLAVDPKTASVAISWFSTALYVGIALAPLAGAAALGIHDAALIPIAGAVLTVLGLAAFLVGYARRRQTPAEETAAVEVAEEGQPVASLP
jgi:MFS transporter, DHA1 family, inner membrane transport protein